MAKILVIDDQRSIRNTLKDILELEGYEVELAENGKDGIEIFLESKYDLVLSDIKMPEMDGLEVLSKIMEVHSDVPVVMISGHGNIDTAVESIKKGAYDFIEKPLDLNRLLITVKNALEKKELVVETKKLKKKVARRYEMIGTSEAMMKMKSVIDKVASTDARVLILGANGTGISCKSIT